MDSFRGFSAEVFVSQSSISVITGSDSAQILNRCSTTEVEDCVELSRIETLYCNSNGRIEDFATLCFVEGGILMIGMPNVGDQTRRMLHNGIAWDEVASIRSGENAVNHMILFGTDVEEIFVALDIEIGEIIPNKWFEFGNILISRNSMCIEAIYDVIIPISESTGFLKLLDDNDCNVANRKRWDLFRIINSIRSKPDLIGRIPHEVGLEALIDTSKGCYPGQEIHARLESRGKVKKKLIKLSSESEIPIGRTPSSFGTIDVTSTSMNEEGCLALAIAPVDVDDIDDMRLNFGSVRISQINHQ